MKCSKEGGAVGRPNGRLPYTFGLHLLGYRILVGSVWNGISVYLKLVALRLVGQCPERRRSKNKLSAFIGRTYNTGQQPHTWTTTTLRTPDIFKVTEKCVNDVRMHMFEAADVINEVGV